MPNMKISGIKHLVLSVPPVQDSEKSLTMIDDSATRVDWRHSREGWANSAILVKALIDYHQPADQYLTTEGVDDALVRSHIRNEMVDNISKTVGHKKQDRGQAILRFSVSF
jgi:hypothetical protein